MRKARMGIEFYGTSSQPAAIVIRSSASVSGIEFFTPVNYSQQIGLMSRPSGYTVPAHIHNEVERTISTTQEVLMIRSGVCLISLLNASGHTFQKITLEPGDVILLATGAHKLQMLTDCQILEVKQGPYAGENDKCVVQDKS
jgi:hypothetical protein